MITLITSTLPAFLLKFWKPILFVSLAIACYFAISHHLAIIKEDAFHEGYHKAYSEVKLLVEQKERDLNSSNSLRLQALHLQIDNLTKINQEASNKVIQLNQDIDALSKQYDDPTIKRLEQDAKIKAESSSVGCESINDDYVRLFNQAFKS